MNTMKELREEAKLTQANVSEEIKVDPSTVAKWETGKSMPRANILPELAKLYGCTVDDLLKKSKNQ